MFIKKNKKQHQSTACYYFQNYKIKSPNSANPLCKHSYNPKSYSTRASDSQLQFYLYASG